MILAALNDYYERLIAKGAEDVSPPGYSQEKISYAILLKADGSVADVNDIRDQSGKKPIPRSCSVPQPEKRTAGIKSNFLWDKTSYVLGVSATSKRAAQEHQAFLELHREALAETEDAGLKALMRFLEAWKPERFSEDPHFNVEMLDSNFVFRLDGEKGYLHERPAARAIRARLLTGSAGTHVATCLVTGEQRPLARLHPAIKGVNGAQSSGASIVSFNLDSFASYGKAQGDNAPVSEQAAFAYTTALNHLLRRDPHNRQRLQIGDASVVFWAQAADSAKAEAAEDFLSVLLGASATDEQEAESVRSVLLSVGVGRPKPLHELDPRLDEGTRMFILGLSPNASRLSIRYWETETLGVLAQRIKDHYDDLRIEPVPWRTPPSIRRLTWTVAPFRKGHAEEKDIPPQLAGELTRAVLGGGPYPRSLLSNIIMRLRADGEISGLRVALCKGVLAREQRLSNQVIHQEVPVSLDPNNRDPGYLLGRLFSVLENVQRAALGRQINATIRDRYYGAASATPANVFPVLLRNAQHHLSRLRKDKPGLAVVLEKELGEIVDQLDATLPKSLRIEAQGRFAIGYYHQTQARYQRGGIQDPETIDSEEGAQI